MTTETDAIQVKATELLDACELEREKEDARHSLRLAKIANVEDSAKAMLDSAPQAGPPQEPAVAETKQEEEPPPALSPPPPKPPARRPARTKAPGPTRAGITPEQREEAKENRRKMLAYVLAHPGCSQGDLAEHLGIDKLRIRSMVQNAARKGDLRATGSTKNRRYFHGQAPLTTPPEDKSETATTEKETKSEEAAPPPAPEKPAPSSIQANGRPGPKTDLEREVVGILKERAQTIGGLSVKMKLTEKKLNPVLSGLVVRGVCRRKNVPTSAKPIFELT